MNPMKIIIHIVAALFVLCLSCGEVEAQYLQGSTGLLTIPTADMQSDGTFMTGVNYMPTYIAPDTWDHNTVNYFLNMTFLPFMEVSYLCTMIRFSNGVYQQDRALAVRLRALKEAKWYPSIVVGTSDAMSFSQDNWNPLDEVNGNRYYGGIYGVATKHFNIRQEIIGVTIGYNYKTQDTAYKDGMFYGVSYSPSIYPSCKIMADLNNDMVSIGAAVKLFNHLSINAYCYDFTVFAGGLRYEVKLY